MPLSRPRDCRRSGSTICATRPRRSALELGEELPVVSGILGHASITTTANVYGHPTDSMLGKAAERTDAILGRRALRPPDVGISVGTPRNQNAPRIAPGGVFTFRLGGEPGRT